MRVPIATLALALVAAVDGRTQPVEAVPQPCRELGMFEGHTDVGKVEIPGALVHDCERDEYRITGSGHNIWDAADAFHMAWIKVTGNVALTATVRLLGQGRHDYRKAGWMLRESLDEDAAYVDVVVHGNGMISLQHRKEKGGGTGDARSRISAPADIRLERDGNQFTMRVGRTGLPFEKTGSVRVSLPETVYVGLVICSHDQTESETALFSHVKIEPGE
jgi:TolB protein